MSARRARAAPGRRGRRARRGGETSSHSAAAVVVVAAVLGDAGQDPARPGLGEAAADVLAPSELAPKRSLGLVEATPRRLDHADEVGDMHAPDPVASRFDATLGVAQEPGGALVVASVVLGVGQGPFGVGPAVLVAEAFEHGERLARPDRRLAGLSGVGGQVGRRRSPPGLTSTAVGRLGSRNGSAARDPLGSDPTPTSGATGRGRARRPTSGHGRGRSRARPVRRDGRDPHAAAMRARRRQWCSPSPAPPSCGTTKRAAPAERRARPRCPAGPRRTPESSPTAGSASGRRRSRWRRGRRATPATARSASARPRRRRARRRRTPHPRRPG